MAEVTLRGHHVPILRSALHRKDWREDFAFFSYIIDHPDDTVRITASADGVCERCNDLTKCSDPYYLGWLPNLIGDYISARASFTKVGETYRASDLVEKLKNQNRLHELVSDISFLLVESPTIFASFPISVWNYVRHRR
jgi:hypothetical protein